MALNSYAGIKSAVAAWLDKTDLTDRIPDFITLAENRLNRKLADNVNLVVKASITFSSPDADLPDDFNGMIALSYDVQDGGVLRYMPASDFFNLAPSGGTPQYFTISAGQVSIWPGPSDTLSLTIRYRTKLDALNLGPNWLLENHPDAYLFGALVEASAYMVEDERVPMWKSRFEETMVEINAQAKDIAFGGPLQVKSCGGE